MIKYILLFINAIGLLTYHFFFAEGITITQKMPPSSKANTEFIVTLVINKGTTTGFAKYQLDLPKGFTAEEGDLSGGSFTFNNQSVKIIWMSLPIDKEFKVTYKVKIAEDISGEYTLASKFSYVTTENVKQSVDIAPSTINIVGPKQVAKKEVSATPQPPVKHDTIIPPPASSISVSRISTDNGNDQFTVEIKVNKENLKGFAKLSESLPEGFTATSLETAGASFEFSDKQVKYTWATMPEQNEFKVSYKISVAANVSGTYNIDGTFSYIENDETKKYTIPLTVIKVEGTAAKQPVAVDTPTTAATTNSNDNADKSLSANTIPSPQTNVHYRVQIAALHKSVDATVLASRYKINETVNTEMTEGFTKYTVGSHMEYKSARDAREEVKNKGVVGPFVTAYNSGKRITVQEALMITNQKWFR